MRLVKSFIHGRINIELIMQSGVYIIIQQNIQQYKKSNLCHTH